MQLAIGSANDRSQVEGIYRSFYVCSTMFVCAEKTKKEREMFQVIPSVQPSSSAGLDNFQSSDRNCSRKTLERV